jgi:hypothetical protein
MFRRIFLPSSSVLKSRYLTLAVTLLTCMRETKLSCLGRYTGFPDVYGSSYQSTKENAGIIS